MREKITFERLNELTRHVGITGEACFFQAMSYHIDISTPAGEVIH